MAEEMRFHIEQYTDDLVRSGVPPEEAARRARMEFGSVDNVKDDCREARGLRLLRRARAQDLRYAVRLHAQDARASPPPRWPRSRSASGANLTIFAVVDSVLLRPLPFPDADRLVSVFNTYPKAGVPDDGCSLTNYYERRGRIAAFARVAAYRERHGDRRRDRRHRAGARSRASRRSSSRRSGSAPVMGRAFTEEETTYETDGVAILTDAYWRQRLDGDPHVHRPARSASTALERPSSASCRRSSRFLSSPARLYFPLASSPERARAVASGTREARRT